MKLSLILSAALAAVAFSPCALALSATQDVYKEVITETETGVTVERMAPDTIIPGDRVLYALTYVNDNNDVVNDIVLTMPVPSAIAFIDGTAENPNTEIVYSADGGATYGSRESRMAIDDLGQMRAANADEITHVRWTVITPVAPGQQGELSFAGLLR